MAQFTENRMTETASDSFGKLVRAAVRAQIRLLAVIGGGLLLASCASSELSLVSVAEANAGLTQGYRIAGGDRLKVSVFDEPTLTGEFGVGLDGSLSLPLIAPIQTSGLVPDQIAARIAAALAEGGFVLAPRVTVEVSQHRPFYILGEVAAPGEYPYIGDLTVEQAIAKARGFTPRANKSEVVLRRHGWNQGKRVRLGTTPLLIAPGDTITVQEAFF
jgi:polysaccharide biosynthesis/export protein